MAKDSHESFHAIPHICKAFLEFDAVKQRESLPHVERLLPFNCDISFPIQSQCWVGISTVRYKSHPSTQMPDPECELGTLDWLKTTRKEQHIIKPRPLPWSDAFSITWCLLTIMRLSPVVHDFIEFVFLPPVRVYLCCQEDVTTDATSWFFLGSPSSPLRPPNYLWYFIM